MQKTHFMILSVLIFVLGLSACGKKAEQDPDHLFEAQERALEKAKQVEDQLQEAADKQRELIEEQSQ